LTNAQKCGIIYTERNKSATESAQNKNNQKKEVTQMGINVSKMNIRNKIQNRNAVMAEWLPYYTIMARAGIKGYNGDGLRVIDVLREMADEGIIKVEERKFTLYACLA